MNAAYPIQRSEHPVVELIRKRAEEGSKPGQRTDGAKLGLAIEGGGMRGVVSAGMVTAIELLGILDCFDVVFGTSAGAYNGAYLVAKQARFGTTIYYDEVNNRNFINGWRMLIGRPAMNLQFLQSVARGAKRLDCETIMASPIPLKVVVTRMPDAKGVVLEDFQSADEVHAAINASSCIPLVGGPPIDVRGTPYMDGGVVESVPWRSALADGCTHLAVFATRNADAINPHASLRLRMTLRTLLRKQPALRDALLARPKHYHDEFAEMTRRAAQPGTEPHLWCLTPPDGATIPGRTEKNRKLLVRAAQQGLEATMHALTGQRVRALEVLNTFPVE